MRNPNPPNPKPQTLNPKPYHEPGKTLRSKVSGSSVLEFEALSFHDPGDAEPPKLKISKSQAFNDLM